MTPSPNPNKHKIKIKKTKAKKLGLKEIRIHMGIFDFNVIVVVGNYQKTCEYVLWKFDSNEKLEEFNKRYIPRGRCFFKEGYVPIIWIFHKPRTTREYATLAHETLHAVWHLFDWANLPINNSTEEVMTHSMSHIINETLIKLR